MSLRLKRSILFTISIIFLAFGVLLMLDNLLVDINLRVKDSFLLLFNISDANKATVVCYIIALAIFVLTVISWIVCLAWTWVLYNKDSSETLQSSKSNHLNINSIVEDKDEMMTNNYIAHKKDND